MTKREALREAKQLTDAGWASAHILAADGIRRMTYGVCAVDPHTGVFTGWHWTAGETYDNSTMVRS